ncbi:MAG: efflux RND transporter periplasmic adaptor subunit [Kiritimatiellia bacterium]
MNSDFRLPPSAALSLLCTLLLSSGCSQENQETTPTLAEMPLAVQVAPVASHTFRRTVTVQGSLESVQSAIVSARVDGPLTTVDVDLGDVVEAGTTRLFQVDSASLSNRVVISREAVATAKAQVAVREAQLAEAEAVAKKAATDANRYERLHKEGRVSDNEYENAILQRETAAAQLAVAKATLDLSRQQVSQNEASLAIDERSLSDATLYAPISGIVNERSHEPGEQIKNGTAVVSINGTKELKALAFLPAQYYSEIIPGKTMVTLSVNGTALPPVPVAAKSPAINTTLRTFEIKVLLEGSEIAVPGAMADFHIILEERNGIGVPDDAVLKRAAGTVVFAPDANGCAKILPVHVGLKNDGFTEVLSGLSADSSVIVKGQTQLYDGRVIKVQTDTDANPGK